MYSDFFFSFPQPQIQAWLTPVTPVSPSLSSTARRWPLDTSPWWRVTAPPVRTRNRCLTWSSAPDTANLEPPTPPSCRALTVTVSVVSHRGLSRGQRCSRVPTEPPEVGRTLCPRRVDVVPVLELRDLELLSWTQFCIFFVDMLHPCWTFIFFNQLYFAFWIFFSFMHCCFMYICAFIK